MTLDEYFAIGRTIDLGSYTFDADAIKAFARRYDPQPFHLDEHAAAGSVFKKLCASGWHTAAVWMKLNIATGLAGSIVEWDGPGPRPVFGPSPGLRNLKWLKPVYAGETVSYTRKALNHRALSKRPGWRVLTVSGEAFDSTGDKVMQFDSGVLVEAE